MNYFVDGQRMKDPFNNGGAGNSNYVATNNNTTYQPPYNNNNNNGTIPPNFVQQQQQPLFIQQQQQQPKFFPPPTSPVFVQPNGNLNNKIQTISQEPSTASKVIEWITRPWFLGIITGIIVFVLLVAFHPSFVQMSFSSSSSSIANNPKKDDACFEFKKTNWWVLLTLTLVSGLVVGVGSWLIEKYAFKPVLPANPPLLLPSSQQQQQPANPLYFNNNNTNNRNY